MLSTFIKLISACTFDGIVYQNGHILKNDGHCMDVRCNLGKWHNTGKMSTNCKFKVKWILYKKEANVFNIL